MDMEEMDTMDMDDPIQIGLEIKDMEATDTKENCMGNNNKQTICQKFNFQL